MLDRLRLGLFVVVWAACDAPEELEIAEVADRGGDILPQEGPPKDGKGDDPEFKACSEKKFEQTLLYPFEHAFVPGLADLPFGELHCAELGEDSDDDGVSDGQEYCEQHVAGSQGLVAAATHFVTFDGPEGLQCGCTCGERPVCAQPSHYKFHDEVGLGTYAKPFEIWTAEQLADLSQSPSGWGRNYVQCRDIDLAAYYATGASYFMIPEFSGDYDGRGKQIRGFTWHTGTPNYDPALALPDVGLFSALTGRVSRLKLTDAQILLGGWDYWNIGTLAGTMNGADVWRIEVTSTIWTSTYDPYRVGGVVGNASGSRLTDLVVDIEATSAKSLVTGVVSDATTTNIRRVEASVVLDGFGVAGIAGFFDQGHMIDGHVEGDVEAKEYASGGVHWATDSAFLRLAADVSVRGKRAGGLIGSAFSCTLDEVRASGSVTGEAQAGGLVATVGNSTLRDCMAAGDVLVTGTGTIDGASAGGLATGISQGSTVTRCYSAGRVENLSGPGPNLQTGSLATYVPQASVVTQNFAAGKVTGPNAFSFAFPQDIVDPSNRYNPDVNPIQPDQGTPVSLASGVYSFPNANFGWTWPAATWTFAPWQLPRLTNVP